MSRSLRSVLAAIRALGLRGYFVGGCVRDCLLGLPVKDIDVVVPGSPWETARALSRKLRGAAFWLREEEQVARVALPRDDVDCVDVLPLTLPLHEDLLGRDLTINAMAINLRDGLRPEAPVIDPAGGLKDLAARRIRFPRPDAVERDPLRGMRAIRFRWQFGFRLARGTVGTLRRGAPLLARVSRERIRDEFFQMLRRPSACQAFEDLVRYRLWPTILPLGSQRWRRKDADARAALQGLEQALAELAGTRLGRRLRERFDVGLTAPRTRLELARWAALLLPYCLPHKQAWPSGMPSCVAGRASAIMRLSRPESHRVSHAVTATPIALQLAAHWPAAGSERLRLFRAAGGAAAEAVLLAAARVGWSRPLRQLLKESLEREINPVQPLLSGSEVMRLLDLPPGPRIGAILEDLEIARADGVIGTPEEARAWLLDRRNGEGDGS